jgi:hypothetical protein
VAITQNGGHMGHGTTETVGPELSSFSTKTGEPGGSPAKSVKARLSVSFPASPMMGADRDYTTTDVSLLKTALLTNSVIEGDAAAAASYYGYPTPTSEEPIPSSPDLTFGGAPTIKSVIKDTNGHYVASPWVPNLRPPITFDPNMDNQTPVILAGAQSSETPLLDPSETSIKIHNKIANQASNGPTTAGSGGTSVGG